MPSRIATTVLDRVAAHLQSRRVGRLCTVTKLRNRLRLRPLDPAARQLRPLRRRHGIAIMFSREARNGVLCKRGEAAVLELAKAIERTVAARSAGSDVDIASYASENMDGTVLSYTARV